MIHRFVEKNISAYIDGELSGLQKQLLAAHLTSCHRCFSKYKHLKSVVKGLREVCRESVPADFENALRSRLSGVELPVTMPAAVGKPVFGLKFAAGVLGLALMIAGSVVLLKPRQEHKFLEATYANQTGAAAGIETPGFPAEEASLASLENQTRRI
ncbi:MAG: anti-sigma factor [Candidatus Firestonebacteria bacterium]